MTVDLIADLDLDARHGIADGRMQHKMCIRDSNYRTLRAHVGPAVKFLGVVKADGYGHGAIQVSRTLEALGADYLAVSSIDEAMELRHNGIAMPILILGHTPREQVKNLIDLHITQAVTCAAKAEEMCIRDRPLGPTFFMAS